MSIAGHVRLFPVVHGTINCFHFDDAQGLHHTGVRGGISRLRISIKCT